jgi:predicted nicotinamide N-methyase
MGSLVNIPADISPITDADEEIFLLYTALNQAKTDLIGPDGYHGLGHVDSRKNTLTVRFELKPSTSSPPPSDQHVKSTRRAKHSRKKASEDKLEKLVEIEIAQDPTALRSRSGDTGSVVWRASTELSKAVLQQHFFPPESPIFDRNKLAECNCLELGSGTGLLGIAFAPLVRTYTVTDIGPLLPLIRKNISLNTSGWRDGSIGPLGKPMSNITVEELDWSTLTSLPSGTARARYCPVPEVTSASELECDNAWDLVLAVDCIYNPSLLPALVDTIDAVSTVGRTWVLVVAELRQEDVTREFLDLWLIQARGTWRITRVEGLLDSHFAVWAGQKS